jgi:hypothetical protein
VIPTEYDDLHIERNEPDIDIDSPRNNDLVGRSFSVEIQASADRGIDRVEYQIDGIVIKQTGSSYSTTLNLPTWVGAGNHTLTVIAYDDIDNQGSDDITIDVKEDSSESSAIITNPINSQEIEKITDTYTIVIESRGSEISSLTLYAQNLWTGSISTVGSVANPESVSTLAWALPSEAEYLIYGNTINNGGVSQDIVPVQVFVTELATSSSSTFPFLSTSASQ